MIIYFSGAGQGQHSPERITEKASIMMTFFDFYNKKKCNPTFKNIAKARKDALNETKKK
jgi:hypothetical protein